jgi:Leucine-rich repeat (LRR) protein
MSLSSPPIASQNPPQAIHIHHPEFSEAEDRGTIAFYQALPSARVLNSGSFQQPFPNFDHLALPEQAAAIRIQLRNYNLELIYELDLSNKGLTSVPSEIALCHSLMHLNLSNNQLQNLPTVLPRTLTRLSLESNLIHTLPVLELPALKVLRLSNNPLHSKPTSTNLRCKAQSKFLSCHRSSSCFYACAYFSHTPSATDYYCCPQYPSSTPFSSKKSSTFY